MKKCKSAFTSTISIYEIILCSQKRSVSFLFCTRFFICIFIFFYLHILNFILEPMEQSLCSKYCVTRDSSDYLTYKTNQNLNFPFYPFSHLLMPNEFFDKKRTGVKTEQLKPHNNKGTLKSRGFLEYAICQLIVFLTVKSNHFSFMARIRIPRVLLDHQYNCIKTVPKGKANHHLFSTYSCERLNFPALA